MNKMRFYITLICARLVYFAIKLLNKSSGTSFVGMLTLKICPEFLSYCKNYVKTSISVTGTNGKTTTSGLLAHILEFNNCRVIHNVKGANMLTGIANVFALNLAPLKSFDYAVLESDEAYLTKLYDSFKTDCLVVTNLFRDQLDRYGELSTTASFIQSAIDKNSDAILLLNADDPLVTSLGRSRENFKDTEQKGVVKYFGFENVEFCSDIHNSASNAPSEVFNCICANPLQYTKQFFAQEGHYFCNECGYKRPEPDFKANVKIYADYSILYVLDVNNDKSYEFRVNLVGLYNAYNALAAISQALILGIDYDTIKHAVLSYKSIFGRAEKRDIKGHETLIQLIKNPTGASEVLKTVDLSSQIVIAINDNYADGRDISWLWDADFEQLKNVENPIVTSGIRARDMAVRLKYAGVPLNKIIVKEDLKDAIEFAVENASKSVDIKDGSSESNSAGKITILPSYTALLKISKMKFK